MGERIRSFAWPATPLGHLADWPPPLRMAVDAMLACDQAMFIVWGPKRILLYNDAYGVILGDKHPDALGQPFFDVWPGLEKMIGPALEQLSDGFTRRVEDAHQILPSRESRMDLACTPLYDDDLAVGGALCIGQGCAPLIPPDRAAYEYGQRQDLAWEAAGSMVFERAIPLDHATYHSAQWATVLGYERSELPAYERFLNWIYEQIHPEDRERIEHDYTDFLAERIEGYGTEARIRHKQGHWMWVRWVARALERNEDGSVRRLSGMMIDITDLKDREEALRRSEAEFRLLARVVESSPGFIAISDVEGNPVWINEAGLEMVGMRWLDARGQPLTEYFVPEDRVRVQSEILPTVMEQGQWAGELRFQHRPTGDPRPVLYHVYRIPDSETGELTHIATITGDLTAKTKAEAQLHESDQRFRALVEASSAGLYRMSPDWSEMHELHSDGTLAATEEASRSWLDSYIPVEEQSRVLQAINRAVRTRDVFELEHRVKCADGTEGWVLSRAVPVMGADGEIVEWFGAGTDVTERRRAEEDLRESDRRKDEFLAMLGHELRNPLTAITSAAQLLALKREPIGAQQLEQISSTLSRQANHLTRMVDDLLDLSRLDRGQITLQQAASDLRELVPQAVESIPVLQQAGAFDFAVSLPETRLMVQGDPVRLTQVITNLLDNAAKYTPRAGWIRVEAFQQGDEAIVRVRDDGKGVNPDILPRLFEPFERGVSRDSYVLGLGLGLPLVKRLLDLHGGSVEAWSPGPGMGSVFTVRLPAQRPEHTEHAPDAPAGAMTPRGRVLLVEDHDELAGTMQMLLESLDQTVERAVSGQDALETARRSAPGLVLIDIGLPDMTGFEVALELRRTLGDTPLIALSGYAASQFPKGRLEVFDDYLVKPPTPEGLQQVLAQMKSA